MCEGGGKSDSRNAQHAKLNQCRDWRCIASLIRRQIESGIHHACDSHCAMGMLSLCINLTNASTDYTLISFLLIKRDEYYKIGRMLNFQNVTDIGLCPTFAYVRYFLRVWLETLNPLARVTRNFSYKMYKLFFVMKKKNFM